MQQRNFNTDEEKIKASFGLDIGSPDGDGMVEFEVLIHKPFKKPERKTVLVSNLYPENMKNQFWKLFQENFEEWQNENFKNSFFYPLQKDDGKEA